MSIFVDENKCPQNHLCPSVKVCPVKGAKSLPVVNFATGLKQFESYKDKPILVHCASGGRSPAAVRLLLKNDFKNVYHINHGLAGWNYGLK